MQDEVDEKCVGVTVEASRMTAGVLADALRKVIADMESHRNRHGGREGKSYKGKVSVEELATGSGEISNIEITDGNIRSFERFARKYGMTYSLMKDRSREPPRYMVFFKAKDVSQMEAAFKEYTGWQMKRKENAKPSVIKKLREKVAIAARLPRKEKTKEKTREGVR